MREMIWGDMCISAYTYIILSHTKTNIIIKTLGNL